LEANEKYIDTFTEWTFCTVFEFGSNYAAKAETEKVSVA